MLITNPAWSDNMIYLDRDIYEPVQEIVPVRMEDIYMIQVIFYHDRRLKLELSFWIYQKTYTDRCTMTREYWNRFRKNLRDQGYVHVRGTPDNNHDIFPIRISYYIRVSHLVSVRVPREDRPTELGAANFLHNEHGTYCRIFERDEALRIQKLLFEKRRKDDY